MALPMRSVGESTARSVGGMRELIQDLVTPDLKATKVTVETLQADLRFRTEVLSEEMKLRSQNLHEEMRSLREEMRLRDSIQTKAIQDLTGAIKDLTSKVDQATTNLRERVAVLEARQSRQ